MEIFEDDPYYRYQEDKADYQEDKADSYIVIFLASIGGLET